MSGDRPAGRAPQAGVTLVEMLVALALFAMVGLASFTMLDTILSVRARTDNALERIAQIDLALTVFSRDMAHGTGGTLRLGPDRAVIDSGAAGGTRGWTLRGGTLIRQSRQERSGALVEQAVLRGIAAIRFRALREDRGWAENWPPEPRGSATAHAIELTLDFGSNPPGGGLRRIVPLSLTVPR